MTAIRAFIAIDLNSDVQKKLGDVIRQIKPLTGDAVRWVPEHNIHVTLKFLGDTSPANLEILKKVITSEAARYAPMELTLTSLGAFPNLRRPRVIWVGVEAPPALAAIQRSIEAETLRLGYAAEDRPSSPHLTLGRLSHNASPDEIRKIGELLVRFPAALNAAVTVKTVTLFRSDLLPGGAVYTPIHVAAFRT
jgi:2'-5' RNA ligase